MDGNQTLNHRECKDGFVRMCQSWACYGVNLEPAAWVNSICIRPLLIRMIESVISTGGKNEAVKRNFSNQRPTNDRP